MFYIGNVPVTGTLKKNVFLQPDLGLDVHKNHMQICSLHTSLFFYLKTLIRYTVGMHLIE